MIRRGGSALYTAARTRTAAATASSSSSSSSSLGAFVASAFAAHATHAPDAVALAVPHRALAWTYGELHDRARAFAAALEDLGYCDDYARALGASVANGPEAMVTYLGCALAGVDARTAKRAKDFVDFAPTRGTVVEFSDASDAGSLIGAHEPITVGEGATARDKVIMWDVVEAAYASRNIERAVDRDSTFYYNSAKGVRGSGLVDMARASARALGIESGDSVCVPVPLAHSMGFAFGALAAFSRGARVVLPPGLASAGESAEAREAMCQVTLDVLASEKCTLVVADSHVLKAAGDNSLRRVGYEALRGGLTKVGSGDAIGAVDAVKFIGVDLLTVGVPKK